jgi:hypothetical protein
MMETAIKPKVNNASLVSLGAAFLSPVTFCTFTVTLIASMLNQSHEVNPIEQAVAISSAIARTSAHAA